jgi:hypothetical protein
MTQVIGLGHYSRTGKDSFANFLVQYADLYAGNPSVKKKSLAWKLKQICHDLYGWAGVREPEFYDTEEGALYRDQILPALNLTPVGLWVDFGTKAVREHVYDRTWLDYLLKPDHGCDILVVPDVRFPNEVAAIHDAGGICIKVIRPGYGPRDTVADRALMGYADWDLVIGKSGDLKELADWALRFLRFWAGLGDEPYQTPMERAEALAIEATYVKG